MDWAKTTARGYKKDLKVFEFGATYTMGFAGM